jgi:DNA-directed RNA polymerase I subunit RPA1
MNRHGYTFRKEKAIKVIEYDIEPKKKLANATMGLKRRDVLPNGALSKKAQRDVNMELDEGVEMSSASSDSDRGDDISEGEEDEDEDMDEEDGVQRVAKTASGQIKGVRGRNERVISAGEVRAHLRLLFMKEPQICALLYGRHGQPGGTNPLPLADMFFMEVIPVTPTRFRPASKMGDDLFENAQNTLLTAIIQTGRRIQDLSFQLNTLVKGGKVEEDMEAVKRGEEARVFGLMLEAIIKLQHDVNSYMDSTKNPTVMRQGKLPPQGVKQVLEKKEGLFRKHMMVSFSTLIRSIRAKAESTGETCQLCCPIRHFSRHQHRNQRNRCSTRLCQKAHLPRTRDPAQCRRDAPTSH